MRSPYNILEHQKDVTLLENRRNAVPTLQFCPNINGIRLYEAIVYFNNYIRSPQLRKRIVEKKHDLPRQQCKTH